MKEASQFQFGEHQLEEQLFLKEMLAVKGTVLRPWVDGAIARTLISEVGDWEMVSACIADGRLVVRKTISRYLGEKVIHLGPECCARLLELTGSQ